MPHYCVFGEAVNVAQKMEALGKRKHLFIVDSFHSFSVEGQDAHCDRDYVVSPQKTIVCRSTSVEFNALLWPWFETCILSTTLFRQKHVSSVTASESTTHKFGFKMANPPWNNSVIFLLPDSAFVDFGIKLVIKSLSLFFNHSSVIFWSTYLLNKNMLKDLVVEKITLIYWHNRFKLFRV